MLLFFIVNIMLYKKTCLMCCQMTVIIGCDKNPSCYEELFIFVPTVVISDYCWILIFSIYNMLSWKCTDIYSDLTIEAQDFGNTFTLLRT